MAKITVKIDHLERLLQLEESAWLRFGWRFLEDSEQRSPMTAINLLQERLVAISVTSVEKRFSRASGRLAN